MLAGISVTQTLSYTLHGAGGSSGESVVVVTPSQPGLSPAMWAALSQTVAQYGQQSVSDEWVQAFIDASLPALRASAQEVERAREEGESQGKVSSRYSIGSLWVSNQFSGQAPSCCSPLTDLCSACSCIRFLS
jgi:hypothetical protein